MNKEEKDLLLKDLCARLPYNTKSKYVNDTYTEEDIISDLATVKILRLIPTDYDFPVTIKPYLRPMSSMTEEEKMEEPGVTELDGYMYPHEASKYIDWLNAKHFDYRGLIEKGLALEAPEGMYN